MESAPAPECALEVTLERAELTAEDVAAFIAIEKSAEGLRTFSAMTEESEVRESIETETVQFIKVADKPIGSITYVRATPEHAHVSGLVVRPEYRRQSIGRRAMEMVLESLKSVPIIDLVTHPENTRAIALYESLGFQKGAVRDDYFGDGEPHITMVLRH